VRRRAALTNSLPSLSTQAFPWYYPSFFTRSFTQTDRPPSSNLAQELFPHAGDFGRSPLLSPFRCFLLSPTLIACPTEKPLKCPTLPCQTVVPHVFGLVSYLRELSYLLISFYNFSPSEILSREPNPPEPFLLIIISRLSLSFTNCFCGERSPVERAFFCAFGFRPGYLGTLLPPKVKT